MQYEEWDVPELPAEKEPIKKPEPKKVEEVKKVYVPDAVQKKA